MRTDLDPGDEGYEGCDDGNDEDTDACLNTCRVAVPARRRQANGMRARSWAKAAMTATTATLMGAL